MTFDVFLWLQHYGNLYQKSAKLAVLPRLFLLISPSKDFFAFDHLLKCAIIALAGGTRKKILDRK